MQVGAVGREFRGTFYSPSPLYTAGYQPAYSAMMRAACFGVPSSMACRCRSWLCIFICSAGGSGTISLQANALPPPAEETSSKKTQKKHAFQTHCHMPQTSAAVQWQTQRSAFLTLVRYLCEGTAIHITPPHISTAKAAFQPTEKQRLQNLSKKNISREEKPRHSSPISIKKGLRAVNSRDGG